MTDHNAWLVRARGVGRRYGPAVALRSVDIEVHPGESVALLGPNGAGKTTLLRILAGVDRAGTGSVEHSDQRVAWVPQQPAVYPRLTVWENLVLFAKASGNGDHADVDGVLRSADLAAYRDRRADRLSTGTLQRLNIAAGLVTSTSLLLLDEPTSTLSPDQRMRLWSWLSELRTSRGTALVFSTQSVGEASRHADRCLVIAHGDVMFDGTPAALAARSPGADDLHSAMQAAFLELVADEDAP